MRRQWKENKSRNPTKRIATPDRCTMVFVLSEHGILVAKLLICSAVFG